MSPKGMVGAKNMQVLGALPAVPLITPGVPIPLLTVPASENSFKARKNACEVHPLKVLFRKDADRFLKCCGKLEELSSEGAVAYVQGRVPESFLKLVVMQVTNIPILLKLRFQMLAGDETGKPIKSLHLSHFRSPNTAITSFFQVKLLFVKFVQVMEAIIPNQDGYVGHLFSDILVLLNSPERNSLQTMDYNVVYRELCLRTVAWSTALAAEFVPVEADEVLADRLRAALQIDMADLFLKNLEKKSEDMMAATAEFKRVSISNKRPYGGGGDGDHARSAYGGGGAGDHAKRGGGGKWTGRGLCIHQTCFVYLGAGKVFDGAVGLKACLRKDKCPHSHDVPRIPVSPADKDRVLDLMHYMDNYSEKRVLCWQ